METGITYQIDLAVKTISLPAFRDILVLAKNAVQGKKGLQRSLELLAPDCFEMLDVDERNVAAIFIHKNLLLKIPEDKIRLLLGQRVFPHVAPGEILQVDLKVTILHKDLIC